jgi:glycosyltransferase involved in cell wall biosynthesis
LEQLLLEHNFEIVELDGASLDFQIKLFSQAALVVAPTGAALTNMLFCRPGTKVIIFMSNHETTNFYFWSNLGAINHLDITTIAGERLFKLTNYWSVHDDYVIDPKVLLKELRNHERMLIMKKYSSLQKNNLEDGKGAGNISTILTVLIFCYNQNDTIAKAIDSVLEQETTYPFEIWLCDDCSTDGTLEICYNYAKKYPGKIKLFAQPVNTVSDPSKVNQSEIAIKNVVTKYFSLLDGDDFWCDNEKIQIALNILENNPEYVTFAHDTLFDDLVNGTQKSLVHEIYDIEIQNPVVLENAPYLHSSARIHRNIVKFPESRQDYDDTLYFYIYLDQGPLYYYDKIMSVYNITGKGVWSSLTEAERTKANNGIMHKINKYLNYKYDEFFMGRIKSQDRQE